MLAGKWVTSNRESILEPKVERRGWLAPGRDQGAGEGGVRRECVRGLGGLPYPGKPRSFPVLDPSARNSSRKIPRPEILFKSSGELGPREAGGGQLVGGRG